MRDGKQIALSALSTIILIVALMTAATAAESGHTPALQQVPLPYSFHDTNGMQWDVQPDGTLGAGNTNIFDSGGRLLIGPNIQYTPGQQAQFDPAQNEIILPPQPVANLNVSRRICLNTKDNWLRFVEVLDNGGPAPVKVPVHIDFQINQPIESAQPIGDGTKQDKPIGLAISDSQRGIAFLGAGRSSKLSTAFNPQPGGNMVEIAYDEVEVPAHQKVALIHVLAVRSSRNEAENFLRRGKERDFLQGLPPDLVRRVVNFPPQGAMVADREILRGDLLDIVELRAGDQYRGTLKETKYSIQTSYGTIELPAERVIGMLSIGDYRPYQLLITSDGEAFGGALQLPVIHLELSSGQITSIPLGSIARIGYRRRAGESQEWGGDGPLLILRSGDRLRIVPPTQAIHVSTRYGRLDLSPQTIATLSFQSDEQPVHSVLLTDGSKFAGLIDADPLHLSLRSGNTSAPVSFAAAAISRLQLAPSREPDEQTPMLVLSTNDRLVGTLDGTLLLDTAFDSLKLSGPEIRAVTRSANSPAEIQVTLWDGATLSGRLRGDELNVALQCGAMVKVPGALIDHYAQPRPMPSASMMKKLEPLLADLGTDDESRANRAADQLKELGPSIAGGLHALRDKQSQVAKDRLDKLLAEFDAKPIVLPAPAQPNGVEENQQGPAVQVGR